MSPNKKFRQIRLDKNLTQSEFGDLLGLKQHKIKDIENEKQKVSIEISLLVENIFSINMRWLLTDRGEKYLTNSDFKKVKNKNINNQILDIDLNQYSDSKEIIEIIELLKFIPKKSLYKLKTKLIEIKDKIETMF